MITTDHVKLLADKFAQAARARDIPTGELYRSIAEKQYWGAKEALFNAIDELANQHKEQPK